MSDHRLVVISDDVKMAEELKIYFTQKGDAIDHSSNIDEFTKKESSQAFDLIILDTQLESEASILCKQLSVTVKNPYIPFMVIVAKRDLPDRIGDIELIHSYEIISKPFDIEELNLRVKNAIKASRRALNQHPYLNKWRFILISNDVELIENARSYFNPKDYELIYALQVEEVLPQLILHARLDVIVFDFVSFEATADVLCWEIRRRAAFTHIPMIFLTKKERVAEKLSNLVILDDSYLPKPFTLQDLDRAIRRYSKSW